MNAYLALIVSFAATCQKDAGVGTVIALMLPHVAALLVVWPLLLAAWHIFGLPGALVGWARAAPTSIARR